MKPDIGLGVVVRVMDESSEFADRVAFVIQERASGSQQWGVLLPGHPPEVDLPLWFEPYQLASVPGEWNFGPDGAEFRFENSGGTL